MNTQKVWNITGKIPRAKLSPLYRLSTLIAAVAMVLLPLIYLGMIVALGWWLYDFAMEGPGALNSSGRATKGSIWMYIVPLFVGVMVIVFMIKPLFSRRPKSVEPRRLRPEDEPELFEFIGQICDLVGAPRPKRVQVDLQVNASAALTHGFWSLFSRNLTLTIGLPLAGGLSAKEFGGVLAHEFGHFAQGAGMMTTYMVRSVSMWFARVVYERDQMDASLEEMARNSDIRIMIVLQIVRFFIWMVRRILWVLMMVGQFISSVLMRQMEFDADHYEIQTSGSEAFVSTARGLRVLGLGAHIANGRMEQSYISKRLVDDLPGYMTHEAELLPVATRKELLEASAKEKTGWLDTHPSDNERIAAAEKAAASGVLEATAPGSALFSDFGALSREVTLTFYRDVIELPVEKVSLLPLAEVTAESLDAKRGGETMEALFHGMLSQRALVYLTPEYLTPEAPDIVARNQASRHDPGDAAKANAKSLAETFDRYCLVKSVLGLNSAKIPVKLEPDMKLASTESGALIAEAKGLAQKMADLEGSLALVIAGFRERVGTALSYLLSRPETAAEVNSEVRKYVSVLRCIAGLDSAIREMRIASIAPGAVLGSLDKQTDQQATYASVSEAACNLEPLISRVLGATKEVSYPLPHAGGTVMLAQYLVDGVSHSDSAVLAFLRASEILSRIFTIYSRIIGRLAILTLEAERLMDEQAALTPAAESGTQTA